MSLLKSLLLMIAFGDALQTLGLPALHLEAWCAMVLDSNDILPMASKPNLMQFR